MKLLVTGGAGFIGSNFIHFWLKNHPEDQIVNLDKLTYAGHSSSLKDLENNPNYQFIEGDITVVSDVEKAMQGIDTIVHFAAESHVDRSIIDPMIFVKTNVLGTGYLLDSALKHQVKRFHLISTDEIFGQLGLEDAPFDENSLIKPRTPYAASKAGAGVLAQAYFETYGLPVTITNSSNNFGPFHDIEKMIPRFITNLLRDQKVPLMGKGENVRDWLYVVDHCLAIETVLAKGKLGEMYCVGGEEKTNLEVTQKVLKLLGKDESFIEYSEHRLGHDLRYAINSDKIKALGWQPEHNFDEWMQKTVEWYKENRWWWEPLLNNRPDIDGKVQKKYLNKSEG